MEKEEARTKPRYSVSIGIRLDPADAERLQAHAEKKRTPVSILVRQWISDKLEELKREEAEQESPGSGS